MDAKVIAALISLTGVIFSLIGSGLIYHFTFKNTTRKIRLELSNQYSERLLEQRLSAYHEIFYLLSSCGKQIQMKDWTGDYSLPETPEVFQEILNHYNKLDSKNGLLYSAYVADVSYDYRKALVLLTKNYNAEIGKSMHASDRFKTFVSANTRLQIALKRDIGIFEVEQIENRPIYEDYSAAKDAFKGAEKLPTS